MASAVHEHVSNKLANHKQHDDVRSVTLKDIAELSNIQIIPSSPYNPQKLILKWTDTHRCLVNALRRIVYADMESMRFEHMWARDMTLFMENPSLSAENIGLQLGQMPFNVRPDDFLWEFEVYGAQARHSPDLWDVPYLPDYILTNQVGHGLQSRPHMPRVGAMFDEIPIQPHARAHLVFQLDVTCTFNQNTKQLEHSHVTTNDLVWKPLDDTQRNMFPAGYCFFPMNIPILTLCEGQTLKLDLWATKGTGGEVAKWMPVENMFFREIPNIRVDILANPLSSTAGSGASVLHMHAQNTAAILRSIVSTNPLHTQPAAQLDDIEDTYKKLQKSCRKNVFSVSANPSSPNEVLKIDAMRCNLCGDCIAVKHPKTQAPIVIIEKPGKHFYVQIESVIGTDAKWIFLKAVKILKKQFMQLHEQLTEFAQIV
jgi:hypothetical protein